MDAFACQVPSELFGIHISMTGENGLRCVSWRLGTLNGPVSASGLLGQERLGAQACEGKQGRKNKTIWESSLALFSNLSHVRKSKHSREEKWEFLSC